MITEQITNREGQRLELNVIERVDASESGYSVTMKGSWGFFFGREEAGDFVPKEGDWVLISYQGFNHIAGIIIEGRVIRAKTSAQIERERKQVVDGFRLEKLERYISEGDALKARVAQLPLPLRKRMARFAAEGGVEFWIDSAGYEMYALEGAAALLRKVADLGFVHDVDNPKAPRDDIEGAVNWINEWWSLNSEKHDYNYKKQMEIVPDFGDGHSGNTAAAAKAMAVWVLEGQTV